MKSYALTMNDIADKLDSIKSARDAIYKAREVKCVCSGFILQYEGGCQCEAGDGVKEAEDAFWVIIRGL